jgi:hypothetical protein
MGKYKYEVYDHRSGRVARGDIIAAFVPTDGGKRMVVQARVEAVNRSSIRASYYFKNELYNTILKDHQWCFIMYEEEILVPEWLNNERKEKAAKYEALIANGQ